MNHLPCYFLDSIQKQRVKKWLNVVKKMARNDFDFSYLIVIDNEFVFDKVLTGEGVPENHTRKIPFGRTRTF